MKELSIEEKAKAYNEALKKAKSMIDDLRKGEDILAVSNLESMFPELKESEDEKMWKLIKKYAHYNISDMALDADHITREQLESWLEKQGQKPFDYEHADIHQKDFAPIEPKFHEGDTMRTLQESADGYTDGMPVVISVDKEYYHCTNELIAIKDQDNYEYPPMNRRQKPAWREEDEKMVDWSITNLADLMHRYGAEYGKVGKCIEWLKSLKCQNTWKPSDEQMEALEHFVRSIGESGYASPYDKNTKLLYSLLEQLKKLREE